LAWSPGRWRNWYSPRTVVDSRRVAGVPNQGVRDRGAVRLCRSRGPIWGIVMDGARNASPRDGLAPGDRPSGFAFRSRLPCSWWLGIRSIFASVLKCGVHGSAETRTREHGHRPACLPEPAVRDNIHHKLQEPARRSRVEHQLPRSRHARRGVSIQAIRPRADRKPLEFVATFMRYRPMSSRDGS
jgi:hypothetical protein